MDQSTEVYYIENQDIRIGVRLHGAELVSLVDKKDGREYMWSGDPAYWNRVSPVLFPFIGKLNGLSYTHAGKAYENVPQHGYARDCDFTLAEKLDDRIWFELYPDQQWKERYPFDFLLRIGYHIEGRMVHVMWTVRNDSSEDLPFSIGAHPAFIMPEGASKNGFYVNFHNGQSRLDCGELNADGLLMPEQRSYPLQDGKLLLSDELFDKDALIIESGQIHTVSLDTPEGRPFIQVRFDTPMLGIWSPTGKKAPFVCIEPWFGRCDRVGYEGSLAEREYGNLIAPGHSFNKEYVIELP